MKQLLQSGPLLQLGWVVALATLIPLGLGIWVDRRLETAPLFILVGAIIGILAGTTAAVRIAGKAIEALGEPAHDDAGPDHLPEGKEDRA